MVKLSTENLFLLEFLVQDLWLTDKSSSKLTISLHLLNHVPLQLEQEDFAPKNLTPARKGKSCLFSLMPNEALKACSHFDILIKVEEKIGSRHRKKIELGTLTLNLSKMFQTLLEKISNPSKSCKTSQVLKRTFPVKNNNNQEIGLVGIFIRLTCFGKLLVTQIQMDSNRSIINLTSTKANCTGDGLR